MTRLNAAASAMKILLDIWSLASENGGPTRSVKGLAKALAGAGCEVVLVSHIPGTVSREEITSFEKLGVRFVTGRSNAYLAALGDSRKILDACKPDIVHTQGLWKLSTHAMNVAAHERGIPVVISPRGMLDPWALSVKALKKRVGLLVYQKRDLKRAAALHATAEMEAEHIRAFGLKQTVIVAPNGVTLPDALGTEEGRRDAGGARERTALFLSRLHPGKGLLPLAEAWARVRPQGWKMVVAGSDQYGHKREVEDRLKALDIVSDWIFVGEADETRKWELLARADLFIHPSISENFGISIAEALAAGVPAIATTGAPWKDILTCRCGWWITRTVENLARTLREATALSDDARREMGQRGQRLIRERYSWPAIARRMVSGYREILERPTAPA